MDCALAEEVSEVGSGDEEIRTQINDLCRRARPGHTLSSAVTIGKKTRKAKAWLHSFSLQQHETLK